MNIRICRSYYLKIPLFNHKVIKILSEQILYYRIGWLSNEGSPGSKIERCDLMNFEYLARKEFNGFSIRF